MLGKVKDYVQKIKEHLEAKVENEVLLLAKGKITSKNRLNFAFFR